MKQYILKRVLISFPVFIGITLLVYILASSAPGSPAAMMIGGDPENLTPEKIAQVEAALGLNQPVYIRYLKWLNQLMMGNFGISYRTGRKVLDMILERLGPTLLLTLSATITSTIIAVFLGVMSAYKPYSIWDYILSLLSYMGVSMPNFFVGLMIIYLFAVKLQILPSSGMYDSASSVNLPSLLRHMVLPMITLCLQQIGSILRQTRGAMITALSNDFIRTSRAQGIRESAVIFHHGLRNALLPIISVLGGMLPFIIGGAVVTEQLFSWPGLGSLMVQSINSRDYPLIMGETVFIAVVILIGNVVLDTLYAYADPRIRLGRNV